MMHDHLLYTLTTDAMVRVWNMHTGKLVSETPAPSKDYSEFKCKIQIF